MHLIQLHHQVIEVISISLEFRLSCRAPELSRVLVFSLLWQGYRYLYSLRGLHHFFYWMDLLRCMLLRLIPFFGLMPMLCISMQRSLSKEFCIPDYTFPGLHLD